MKLDKTYAFGDDEALMRMQALTDYWSTKYGVHSAWSGSKASVSGKVKGVKFNGELAVGGGRVRADIRAGFLAEKLGGQQYVDGKVDDYLNPSHTIEQLRARIS